MTDHAPGAAPHVAHSAQHARNPHADKPGEPNSADAPGTRLLLLPRFALIDLAYALCFGVALRGVAVGLESLARGGFVLPGLPLIDGQLSTPQWIWMIWLPLLLSPVVEEWVFRGIMQPLAARGLIRTGAQRGTATVAAVVLVAVLFGIGHVWVNPGASAVVTGVVTFAVGLACGAMSAFTGRLGTAIGVHFVFNATGVGMLLLGTFG